MHARNCRNGITVRMHKAEVNRARKHCQLNISIYIIGNAGAFVKAVGPYFLGKFHKNGTLIMCKK